MILNSIEQGGGPPLILLHGLFGTAKNLGVIARGLSAPGLSAPGLSGGACVISMDMRNHGASPHSPVMDYETMADDVAETMAAMGVAQAMVAGHSMGGKTAMMLALKHPEMVSKLAVLDIAPVSYTEHGYIAFADAMLGLPLSAALTRGAADKALEAAIPEPDFRAFLLNNLALGAQPHWRVALAEIRQAMPHLLAWQNPEAAFYGGPALFLHGGRSGYVRPEAYANIAALFPRSQIETVPDAAHWLHADQPRAVVAALQAFFG